MPVAPKRVDASVAERRGAARTGAAVRFPEARGVTMLPHRRAGADAIRGDDLVLAALLLCVEDVAVDGERRPAGTDRPAPQSLSAARPTNRWRCERREQTPSRSRPRNPGHSASAWVRRVQRVRGCDRCIGCDGCEQVRGAAGAASAASATKPEASGGVSSGNVSTRSSAVGDHRHARSLSNAPVKPPVRTVVHTAQATTMAATMVTRCTAIDHGRLTTAQITNARQMPGTASIGKIMPIAPVASDTSRNGKVAAIAAIMTTIAAIRSNHAARLKNSHQTTIAKKPANPAMTAYIEPSTITAGRPKRSAHCVATIATPGHNRSRTERGTSTRPSMSSLACHFAGLISTVRRSDRRDRRRDRGSSPLPCASPWLCGAAE